MRKLLTTIALALTLAAPGAAFAASTAAPAIKPMATTTAAAQSANGTVKAFDLKAHTLTLSDGNIYRLPATFKDPGLKVGEKVTVQWKMNGTNHDATGVTIG